MANKKKLATSVAAVATAAAVLLGGTFAWQSISQTALNEASDVVNPGGRLHDDFIYTEELKNKDVYVENFADEDIFARVRLDEYFEITMNKGAGDAEKTEVIVGVEKDDPTTYVTHQFDEKNVTDDYWEWTTGGSAKYLPTFNLNKDSLQADINGTYTYVDPDTDENVPYGDYVNYQSYDVGYDVPGTEIYDADANDVDDENVTEVEATHAVKEMLYKATLMSMDEWIEEGSVKGPYWVYDTDGWVYWAQPIAAGETTGLLLDNIQLTQVMDDSWYYAINVVGQFITADDLGKVDNTGFYADGQTVSEEALALLETIGVDVSGESADDGEDEPDYANGFTIYSYNADESEPYADGETVILSGNDTYELFLSYGVEGKYYDDYKDAFNWEVTPETLEIETYSNTNDGHEENLGWYVYAKFTLDENVPADTYTITATNTSDGTSRTAYIVWEGVGGEDDEDYLEVILQSEPDNYTTYNVRINEPIVPDEDGGPLAITYEENGETVTLVSSEDYTYDEGAVILTNENLIGKTLTLTVDEREAETDLWGCYLVVVANGEDNGDETPSSYTISVSGDNGAMMASNGSLRLILLKNGEPYDGDVLWTAPGLNITEDDEVSFTGAAEPLSKYTVTAADSENSGIVLAAIDIYVYDADVYEPLYPAFVTSPDTGATYYVFDYAKYTPEENKGIVATQLCVYKLGDDVSLVYYYRDLMNFAVNETLAKSFDNAYAESSMTLVSEIAAWPVEG